MRRDRTWNECCVQCTVYIAVYTGSYGVQSTQRDLERLGLICTRSMINAIIQSARYSLRALRPRQASQIHSHPTLHLLEHGPCSVGRLVFHLIPPTNRSDAAELKKRYSRKFSKFCISEGFRRRGSVGHEIPSIDWISTRTSWV